MACPVFFLRAIPWRYQETLNHASTEAQPSPGKRSAKLPEGDISCLTDQFEDQLAMRLDVARAAVHAQCSRPRIALRPRPSAPSADAPRAHAEPRRRTPVVRTRRKTRTRRSKECAFDISADLLPGR